MRNQLKIEIRKALLSPYFIFGCGILTLFAALSAVYMLEKNGGYTAAIKEDMANFSSNPDLPLFGFYSSWVGAERMSLANTLFYNLLPVGASLPFAWSFYTERKNGYIKNVVTRDSKKNYFAAKTCTVFISGALAVAVPLIINIMIVSFKMPLYATNAKYNFYNGVYFGGFLADMFYFHPGVHALLYAMLTAFYGGLFSLLGAAVSFFVPNVLAAVFLPFLIMLGAGYAEHSIHNMIYAGYIFEFIPTQFLHATTLYAKTTWWIILIVTFIIALFSLLTIYLRGYRHEVY